MSAATDDCVHRTRRAGECGQRCFGVRPALLPWYRRRFTMSPAASLLVAALAFHADAGEYSNAVYNVLCLAQQVSCTREKYDQLWKDELRWSAEDETQLDRWRSIVRAGESREPAPPVAPLLANHPSFYPALRKRTEILAAALDAKSISAF